MKTVLFSLLVLVLISCGGSKTAPATDTTGTTTTTTTSGNTPEDVTLTTETLYANASVTISASPSTTALLGGAITLTATVTGINDPTYDFYYISGNTQYITAWQNTNLASISSSVSTAVVIGVQVTSISNRAIQANNQIALQFGTIAPTPTPTPVVGLNCTLGHTTVNPVVYGNVHFFITTSTGEAVKIVSWDPGEAWHTAIPTFPISLAGTANTFYGHYYLYGQKNVRILAESVSRPGVYCNNGALLSDTVIVGY